MNPIFEVLPDQIEAFGDTDFKDLMTRLAKAEVHRYGHSTNTVTHGGKQDTKDGGVDIRVAMGKGLTAGYLPSSNVILQVKATEMKCADIRDEMRPKGYLRDSIVELAGDDGTYIIACSKENLTDLYRQARVRCMREAVSDEPRAASLGLLFYESSTIAGWTSEFPAIALWVWKKAGLAINCWHPFGNWSGEHQAEFLSDGRAALQYNGKTSDGQTQFDLVAGIDLMRSKLTTPGGAVRLVGLSGAGKTRLLQALFDSTIGTAALEESLAIYTDCNDSPIPSPTALLHLLQLNNASAVLVVDNCSSRLHRQLIDKLSTKHSISLITVEHDVTDGKVERTEVFKLELTSPELIEKFLRQCYPSISASVLHKIASASEGNWRIANVLAESIDPDDEETALRLENGVMFRRLFWQNKVEDPQLYRAAQACSLVYSFQVDPYDGSDAELPHLAALANCSPETLYGQVAELKRRNLVQARSIWRALLPQVLARRLATDALENFPMSLVKQHLIDSNKPRLRRSFLKRLGELHDVDNAKRMAESFLQRGGWLSQPKTFGPAEIEGLELIAPLIQKKILSFLQDAIESDNYPYGQQSVLLKTVTLLMKLAYEEELFDVAFKVIISLVQRTPEPVTRGLELNKVTKLFQREISGTNATVVQKIAALQMIADSNLSIVQALLPKCFEAMLQTVRFSSASLSDFGSRMRSYGRQNRIRGEYFQWYYSVLQWATGALEKAELRPTITQVIAANIRGLLLHTRMTVFLLSICRMLAAEGPWISGLLGIKQARAGLLKPTVNFEEEAKLCEATLIELAPVTLQARLEAYLSDEVFREEIDSSVSLDPQYFDIIEKVTHQKSAAMAAELLGNPVILAECSARLLSCSTGMLWHLMREIGRQSPGKLDQWQDLWKKYQALPPQNKSDRGLCAFVAGVETCDELSAEKMLDNVFENVAESRLFIEMHACLKLTSARFNRILEALQRPGTNPVAIYWLNNGTAINHLDSDQLERLVIVLLRLPEGLRWAIELVHHRLYWQEMKGRQLSAEDASVGLLLLRSINVFEDVRDPSRINYVAKVCLPFATDEEVIHLLDRLKADALEGYHLVYEYPDYLSAISKQVPDAFLESLVVGDSAVDWRRLLFDYWDLHLHPSIHPLQTISEESLSTWAAEVPDERWGILMAAMPLWEDANGRSDEEAQVELRWTGFAKRMLTDANDSQGILNAFYVRLAYAFGLKPAVLESRLPLFQQLWDWNIKGSRQFSESMRPKFERVIREAYETEEERNRLETGHFEY